VKDEQIVELRLSRWTLLKALITGKLIISVSLLGPVPPGGK
jgi:hypothetical protein